MYIHMYMYVYVTLYIDIYSIQGLEDRTGGRLLPTDCFVYPA